MSTFYFRPPPLLRGPPKYGTLDNMPRAPKKRPVGHPELPPDKRRTVTLRTRVTRSEAATVRDKRPAWEKIRGRYGSESEFLRDVLLS